MRIHKIRFGWLEQKQTFITHLYITKNVFLLSASLRRSSRESSVEFGVAFVRARYMPFTTFYIKLLRKIFKFESNDATIQIYK